MEEIKLSTCNHLGHITGLGVWWCDLKDENGKQKHPHINCENCPDKDEITYTTDTSNSLSINQIL